MSKVFRNVGDLKGFSIKNCASMPEPGKALMCAPDFYDVIDVKNPFMREHVGRVNKEAARREWEALKSSFEVGGKQVLTIPAVAGLEDMVFTANQALLGLTPRMEKVAIMSSMQHPSRRREVPFFETWLKEQGYAIKKLKNPTAHFEGAGDAIWHPGKRLLWGGHGFRSESEVYDEVSEVFDAPVVSLKLVNERFYHLDTCFCPLTSEAVLIYPSAFDAHSLELILKLFPVVLTATEAEAVRYMACNAAVLDSKTAVIQKGTSSVRRHMEAMGLHVVEVETTEFMKSGGSAYCLKNWLF
jgi:N-dimethylarginine dimethylaminohydrolase